MAELTPEMQAAGIFLDANGIPTLPDGSPALRQNQPPSDIPQGDTSAPLLAEIARQAAASNVGAAEPAPDTQTVNGEVFGPDPLAYNFGPYYGESAQNYPENRVPNMGMGMDWEQPGSWEQFHNPRDRSTGGGFFTAQDVFGADKVPNAFQEGAASPSTNNWRLLPPPYNSPRYIMRNGRIIDLRATDMHGPPVPAEGFGNNYGGPLWNTGAGAGLGFPAAYNRGYTNFAGWPGTSNWANAGSYWIG